MELYNEPSHQYLSGYNDAHLPSVYEPGLLEDISPAANPSSEYFDGFFDAKAEWHEQQINHDTELSDLRDAGREQDGMELDR